VTFFLPMKLDITARLIGRDQMLPRAATAIAFAFAAFVLTGCLVTSKTLPAGSSIIDDRLVGTWRGVNDDGKDSDAFLHFMKQAPDKPLRLLWVDDGDYQVYDVTTLVVGKRYVFAAVAAGSAENPPEPVTDDSAGYILGFYEVRDSEASFSLLDSKKVSELISKGVVKGTPSTSASGNAALDGTPEELAKFLASDQGYGARWEEPAKMRRLTALK
jgi:hypothetical protein